LIKRSRAAVMTSIALFAIDDRDNGDRQRRIGLSQGLRERRRDFFCGGVATWRQILSFLAAAAAKGYDVRTYGRFVRVAASEIGAWACRVTLSVTRKGRFIVRAVRNRKLASQMVSRAPKGRSKVTNGKQLFLEGDARLKVSRRFRDVLASIATDLGGVDRLSEGQRQIARRCARLSVECEIMDSAAVAGEPFDLDVYGQLTD
jgi:hypothetical protein